MIEAEFLLKRSLAIREKKLGPDDPDTAESFDNVARAIHALGRFGEAEPLYRRALAIRETRLPASAREVASSFNIWHYSLWMRESLPRRNPSTIALWRSVNRPFHPSIPTLPKASTGWRGCLTNNSAWWTRSHFQKSLAIQQGALPKDHPDIASTLYSIGVLHRELGDTGQRSFGEAESLLNKRLRCANGCYARAIRTLQQA